MALSMPVRTTCASFFAGSNVIVLSLLLFFSNTLTNVWSWRMLIVILSFGIFNLVLWAVYRKSRKEYEIAVRAGFLGWSFGTGVIISFADVTWTHFGWYLTFLALFHWSEYVTTALTNPRSLTLDSYLMDHSPEYKIAAVCSWVEFFIEWYIFPDLKQWKLISICGLGLVLVGETLRKASMFTASSNFNHYIQWVKQRDHQLVTHGVYSLCRHPSYLGWFVWSIGTQVILCNPLCLVGYTIASWRFFRERIYDEEICLVNFFGKDYLEYQSRVGTGLPFIYGYRYRE